MNKQTKNAETVEDYLKELPAEVKTQLTKIRKAIISAAPKAAEKISYRIPVYRLNGDLVAFAAFKNHCSLVTMSTNVINKLKKELEIYKISGTTIQFSTDKPIPPALVRKIVSMRVKENSTKITKKHKLKDN